MSRPSRDKGLRAERVIVAAHGDLGIAGERVPLSGAARYRGNGADVDLYVFGPDGADDGLCPIPAIRNLPAEIGPVGRRTKPLTR